MKARLVGISIPFITVLLLIVWAIIDGSKRDMRLEKWCKDNIPGSRLVYIGSPVRGFCSTPGEPLKGTPDL